MTSTAGVSNTAHTVPMTTQPLVCPAPVLTADFDHCSVPGGLELWRNWGYYSPGICFIDYVALCTQTVEPSSAGWSIDKDETAVRCVPVGYECNDKTADQRYAISLYNDMTLSAPAFEIRWRSGDVNGQFSQASTLPPSSSEPTSARSTGSTGSGSSTASSTLAGAAHRAGDMSPGKIAGVVIGVAVAMCAGLAAALVMHFRRKQGFAKAQPNAKAGRSHSEAAELGTAAISELQSEAVAKELASNRPKQYDDHIALNSEPVELPGDQRPQLLS